jgi:hypothetical protein
LTSGRTWQEKIIIRGNYWFTNASSLPIIVPDYTIIELQGQLRLGSGMNKGIFERTNDPKFIEVCGGTIDGNKAGQEDRILDIFKLWGTSQTYESNIRIHDISLCNASRYAINLYANIGVEIFNVRFWGNDNDVKAYCTEDVRINGCYSYGVTAYFITLDGARRSNVVGNTQNYGNTFLRIQDEVRIGVCGVIADNNGNPTGGFISINPNALTSIGYMNPIIRNNLFWHGGTGAVLYPIRQRISNPFHTSSGTISPSGTVEYPATVTNYTAWGFDYILYTTGGTVNDVTVYDGDGNIVTTGQTTLNGYYLPNGFKIRWTYSDPPTVSICGV